MVLNLLRTVQEEIMPPMIEFIFWVNPIEFLIGSIISSGFSKKFPPFFALKSMFFPQILAYAPWIQANFYFTPEIFHWYPRQGSDGFFFFWKTLMLSTFIRKITKFKTSIISRYAMKLIIKKFSSKSLNLQNTLKGC